MSGTRCASVVEEPRLSVRQLMHKILHQTLSISSETRSSGSVCIPPLVWFETEAGVSPQLAQEAESIYKGCLLVVSSAGYDGLILEALAIMQICCCVLVSMA